MTISMALTNQYRTEDLYQDQQSIAGLVLSSTTSYTLFRNGLPSITYPLRTLSEGKRLCCLTGHIQTSL